MKCHTHSTTCLSVLLLLSVLLFFGTACNSTKKLSRVINQEKTTIDSTHTDSTHIVKEVEKETEKVDSSQGNEWSIIFSQADTVKSSEYTEAPAGHPVKQKTYRARVKVSADGSIDIESNQPIAGIKGSNTETHSTESTKEKEKSDSSTGSKTNLKKKVENLAEEVHEKKTCRLPLWQIILFGGLVAAGWGTFNYFTKKKMIP